MMGFPPKKYFLQVSNINLASKRRINTKQKKAPKLASKSKTETLNNPKKMQLKCHPWWL